MNFKSSSGAVFAQTLGPNTRARFVGCVDVDALNEPGGAINEILRCFNEDGSGWKTLDSTVTPPDPVTTSITTLIEGTANTLEQMRGGISTLFVHQRAGGRQETFGAWERSWVLEKVRVGDRTVNDIAMREEDNFSMMAFAISALPPLWKPFQKTTGRQSVAIAEAFNDIHFCGVGYDADQIGFAVGDADSGSPSDKGDVVYTIDGGTTWTACTTRPFAGAENITAITCFSIGRNTTRAIAARGTTDAGNPMEIAYTDDFGATAWNAVNVGSVNGQFAPGPDSLFAYDPYNIWLVAGAGYIYYSDDGGLTWAVQDAGVATANDLYAIHFSTDRIGYAVGEADTILKTEDGGQSWTATADNTGVSAILRTVHVLPNRVWVGSAAGQLWYSEDEGATWLERAFTGSGAGVVANVKFAKDSELFGFMAHNSAAPVGTVFATIDGGYSWDAVTTFTNTGINGMYVHDLNTAFFAGEPQGSTGVIGKVFAKP
ncbi:MAG TPA: hypothetical protein DEP36_01585 [Gammaproteobacteria bacterium]|nr:hypothetical protein [Gammaproteobacteria bacterium]